MDTLPRRLLAPPGPVGAAFALVFVWQSFMPTLMPRTWVAQAAITGLCAAIGYALGTLTASAVRRLLRRAEREVSARAARAGWVVVAAGAGLVVTTGLVAWARWQNDQRDLLAMDHLRGIAAVPMLLVTALVAVVLGVLGRLVGAGVGRLHRFTNRHLPGGVATAVTAVLVVALAVFLLRDVLGSRFVSSVNSAFGTVDVNTSDGTVQPDDPLVSGSPESLAPWDTLGRQGRDFVASATSVEQLRAFHGPDAEVVRPIRVYTGLRTAGTADERAALAVDELVRTGAFERSVLAVTTVTGTGWVDPDAALALEMLHRGDTAMVAMQYSYLPSWISTFVDSGSAQEAGAVLYDAVHRAWSDLPEGERPTLVMFGQSLGSYGGEAAFTGVDSRTSVANLVSRSDGALFTGPTNDNVLWQQLIADRDSGSPVWRPIVDGGRSVRFANRVEELVEPDPSWEHPRILYVQHPSDPVTFWSMDTLWSAPEWMDHPRGHDVPDRGSWFPIVTWVQGIFDLMAGFGAPPGHGHDYRLAFAGAWSQVVPPDGWTSADTARLSAFVQAD